MANNGRVRQLDRKQAKQKSKKAAAKLPRIPSSFQLLRQTFSFLWQNWQVLTGIALVYSIINVIFAGNLLGSLNDSLNTIRQHQGVSNALNGYGSLLSNSSGGSQTSSVAQSLLLIFESLVIIWAIRHLLTGQKIRVKQAYYQSMTPLVPFLLIVLVIVLQLLPLTIGSAILAVILSGTFGSGGALTLVFVVLAALLAAWTIYMTSASIFSIYIVTLPDMQPRQALRSAKNLVKFRRWIILRRLFFLPVFLLLSIGIITTLLILLVPFLVVPLFFILLMLSILFVHTYLYCLYRGLIS